MGRINKLYREESVWKLLLRFSFPIMLSYLVAELYGMADSLFVGNFVGDNAIAALSVIYPIQRIFLALGTMLGVGFSTVISRSNGEGDTEKIKKSMVSGLYSTLLIITIFAVFVFVFKERLLILVGATNDLMQGSIEYLNVIIWGTVLLCTTIYISQALLSFGNSKVSLNANLLGAIVNVGLDYLLVVKFNMGLAGAGIATLISQAIGFIYAMAFFVKYAKEYNISLKPNIDMKIVVVSLAVGISAFAVESVDGVVTAVLNSLVGKVGGANAISILGISLKVYMFLFLANFAVASAMQPIVSYSYGQNDYKRLFDVVAKATILSIAVQAVSWLFCMIFAPQLVGMFTTNHILQAQTVTAFRFMILTVPVSAIYYISIFYFQALGRVKMSLFMSLFRHIFVMLPLSILLAKGFNMGLMGVWIAYPISDTVVGLFSLYQLREERKELLGEKEKEDMLGGGLSAA